MRLTIDYESRSACDLIKCGAWVYSEHPTTEVMCCAVKVDSQKPKIWLPDWTLQMLPEGHGLPLISTAELYDLIAQADEIEAHNAGFETAISENVCTPKYGWPPLPTEKLRCSMAKAAYHNLPQKLELLCSALELPIKKDMVGNTLMRKMCKPRKPLKKEVKELEAQGCIVHGKDMMFLIEPPMGADPFYLWHEKPEELVRLCEYCLQDVEAEHAASTALPDMPLSEIRVWQLDQRINRRGCKVDTRAVRAFLDEVDRHSLGSHALVEEVTGGAAQTVKQVAKCLEWIKAQGVELPNLAQDTVVEALERDDLPDNVRGFLRLRQQFGKASTSKYPPILLGASRDERFRGAFVYHGAGTGRFCLAEGTPIIVKEGEDEDACVRVVPINRVVRGDLVWDGDEWVAHEGVVLVGRRSVIEYDGITATPEHEVYVSETEKTHLIDARDAKAPLLRGKLPPGVTNPNWRHKCPTPVAYTYDIINAGPHNRFMANGRIVSNSSRRAQLHNLPRGKFSDAALCIETVLERGYDEWAEFLFGDFMAAASTCIRGMFIAEEGKKLYVGDFSSVEARFLVWLAGEETVVQAFRDGVDVYKMAASQIFNKEIPQITKSERQVGKTVELACIAEGQLVLTDVGLVPIQDVTLAMKVWDGGQYVFHDGVICRETKTVITYQGLTATPDHLVWIKENGTHRQVHFGLAAASGQRLLQSGSGREPIRVGEGDLPGAQVPERLGTGLRGSGVHGLRGNRLGLPEQPCARVEQGLPSVLTATAGAEVAPEARNRHAGPLREPKVQVLGALRGKGHPVQLPECSGGRPVDSEESGAGARPGFGPDKQQRPLRGGESSVRNPLAKRQKPAQVQSNDGGRGVGADAKPLLPYPNNAVSDEWLLEGGNNRAGVQSGDGQEEELAQPERRTEEARVYDIVNAGPLHRFTVSDVLVHNCGYQGGINAFATMATNYGIDLESLPAFILPVAPDEVVGKAEKMAKQYVKENPGSMSVEAATACDVIKQLWRLNRPRIVALWAALEEAAILAVKNTGKVYSYNGIKYLSDGRFLRCKLPSGRCLHYYKPLVERVIPRWVDQDAIKKKVREENPGAAPEALAALVKARLHKHSKELVTFWGVSSKPGPMQGKFIKQPIYGGLLVENCLAHDTLVVTQRGAVPIPEVHSTDKVWDGYEWVGTDGAVCNGIQEVGEWLGIRITQEHLIRVGKSWRAVIAMDELATQEALESGRSSVGCLFSTPEKGTTEPLGVSALLVGSFTQLKPADCGEVRPSVARNARALKSHVCGQSRKATSSLSQTSSFAHCGCTDTRESSPGATTRTTKPTPTTEVGESAFTHLGKRIAHCFSSTRSLLMAGTRKAWTWIESTMTGTTSRGTCASYPVLSTPETGALLPACSTPEGVTSFRSSTKPSPLDGKASTPSRGTSTTESPRSGLWTTTGKHEAVYDLLNCGPRHRFMILTNAGPVLVHNCTQAGCRDLLTNSLLNLEDAGYPVVLHVHDEGVAETPEDFGSLEEYEAIMAQAPAWADGMPMGVEGFETTRYKK